MLPSTETASILLSINRGLWGEVPPQLRHVMAKFDSKTIEIRFFIDGAVSDEDVESARCVATEVLADFPNHHVKEQCVQLDYPSKIPFGEGWRTIYQRKEPIDLTYQQRHNGR
jgi:hypothetical protein